MLMRCTSIAPSCVLAAFIACTGGVQAQTSNYTIEPVAGAQHASGDNGPATAALLWSPQGVSVDAAGNLIIADTGNGRIRRVTPGGLITTIAGSTPGHSGENVNATSAQLAYPSKAVVAPTGDIYIADGGNHQIRRVSPGGVITTIAGTGQSGFPKETDLALSSLFTYPRDIAVDASGNLLVLDTGNGRLWRFTPGGRLSAVAGSGVFGFYGDQGPARDAQLASPWGMAVDRGGVIYIADTMNNRVRRIGTDGVITTIAGLNESGFSGDNGQATFARLNRPTAIAVDGSGNVYVADTGNNRIRKIDSRGIITTIAGTATGGFSGDNGPGTSAQLNMPESLALDAAGNLYIADTSNHRVRKLSPQGIMSTVAGSDTGAGDNGPALNALLFQPSGLAFDSSGNLYIADTLNNRIRRVSPDGNIITVAGNGSAGYSGDNGPATRAQLNNPNGVAVDRAGTLYIADTFNNVIRRVAGGTISTVAGTGVLGNTGDGGPASAATLFNPNAVAVGTNNNVYIADSGNNRIRVVDPSGAINNFAGDPTGVPGVGGDNISARDSKFDYPRGLAVDAAGNVYVSDYFNNRIRRIASGTNVISNYAGTGVGSFGGDGGPATQALLHLPAGIAFDRDQNLYVADLLNDRIRVIAPNGVISTIAGMGIPGNGGDYGPALSALLYSPAGVAVDAQGNVYFSDQDNNEVRRLVTETTSIRTIVNAASGTAGFVAPGEVVTIFGTRLGPGNGVSGSAPGGLFGSAAGGTRVLFDGVAAPILYAGSNQVNVIVPYEVGGKSTVRVQVETNGNLGAAFSVAVRDAAPGLFTSDSSGRGQAAALNENGTLNSPSNPAAPDSIVTLFATGEGQTIPNGITGRVVSGDVNFLPRPLQRVTVQIQGIAAQILYAGAAPQSAGLMQINVRVPGNLTPGDRVSVDLTVGTFAAQPTVTIAVR